MWPVMVGYHKVRNVCKASWVLDPHRCSPELSTGSRSLSAHTLRASRQVEHYVRVTVVKGCRSLVYLRTDAGTTGNYGSVSLWLRTTLEWEPPYRHQARPWAGVQYVRVMVLKVTKPKMGYRSRR